MRKGQRVVVDDGLGSNYTPSSATRAFVSIHWSRAWGLDLIHFTASTSDFSDPVSPAQECIVFPNNKSTPVCRCGGKDDIPPIMLLAIPVLAVTATMNICPYFCFNASIITFNRNDFPQRIKMISDPQRKVDDITPTSPTSYEQAFSSECLVEYEVLLLIEGAHVDISLFNDGREEVSCGGLLARGVLRFSVLQSHVCK